jgi:hypothetical protein
MLGCIEGTKVKRKIIALSQNWERDSGALFLVPFFSMPLGALVTPRKDKRSFRWKNI